MLGGDPLSLAKSPLEASLYPHVLLLFCIIKEWSLIATSLMKNLRNLLTALSCLTKMIVKKDIMSVWQLTLFPLKDPNVFQIRHWLLTLTMSLILMMLMSLTYNCHMILISLLNLSYGMVTFILFLFMAFWSIFLLTLIALRSLLPI